MPTNISVSMSARVMIMHYISSHALLAGSMCFTHIESRFCNPHIEMNVIIINIINKIEKRGKDGWRMSLILDISSYFPVNEVNCTCVWFVHIFECLTQLFLCVHPNRFQRIRRFAVRRVLLPEIAFVSRPDKSLKKWKVCRNDRQTNE
jgi:hypothetical protein